MRCLFIKVRYLPDFFHQWSRHFCDNSILGCGLSSCLNFLEGKIKGVFEWQACLALLHSHKDPITVAHSLLSHRIVGIEELVAANRHASKDICSFLCLSVLDELHCCCALIKHENGHQVSHKPIKAVRLRFRPNRFKIELIGSHCLSPHINLVSECLQAEGTDQVLLLITLEASFVQAERLLVILRHNQEGRFEILND